MRFRNQSGQAAIVILFSFITLFLILALTINVGIYIHDKINLQNAADAGAYAGAAEQARLLQEVGYANYELRQLYKRFIYDYRYRFSIDSDRDPIVSPSICVNFPFCDCVIPRATRGSAQYPYGIRAHQPFCGSASERAREMIVDTHGTGNFVHQMPWNVNEPYDCRAQTEFNRKQAEELKEYYEAEFANSIRSKLPEIMKLINDEQGQVKKIAEATIKANLSPGNNDVDISYPRAPNTSSSSGLPSGKYLSLIQKLPRITYRIYYTVWEGPISTPSCFYRGRPNCTLHTCIRHHAASYLDMTLPGIWFLKNPKLTTAFVTKIKRKARSFPFAFNFFGQAPEMQVVSAAKPFGSSVGWPDPYSEQTIVPELYVNDTDRRPQYSNKFLLDSRSGSGIINPSYLDFMEAFYWFEDQYKDLYQSLTGETMPIPLVATARDLERLHFTFDSEAFPGMNKAGIDRVRFETSWPYDPQKGITGRSGYSVKFVAIKDLTRRYKGNYNIPEAESIEH